MAEYKMTFGRKFWAGIFGVLVLLYLYTVTLFQNKDAVTGTGLITFGVLVVSIVFAYIGGNVWNKWVKSKFFQADILNGAEK